MAVQIDPTELAKQTQEILDQLMAGRGLSFRLKVDRDSVQPDGEWVYVVVNPDVAGVRAYDYVELLTDVEASLRARVGFDNIILVPTIPD